MYSEGSGSRRVVWMEGVGVEYGQEVELLMGSKTDNYEVEASTDETFGFPCARKSCSYIGPRLRILYPALPYVAQRNEVIGNLLKKSRHDYYV